MKSSKSKSCYCSNCGKYGHNLKKCEDPITSLGVICVKFDNIPLGINSIKNEETFKKFISSRYLEIDNYNFNHIDNINKLDFFKKNIKFMMIQRKCSLSYIEFIRGKYNINNLENLKSMFKRMSPDEIENISKLNFDNLWNSLWEKTSKSKLFQKEYKKSKELFQKLILNGDMLKLVKVKPDYSTPEWGFPKGRRNLFEKNLDCALRELEEETTISVDNINILNKINCVNEEYTGTNNQQYRHIYYLGYVENEKISDEYLSTISNYEVGKIGWFSWDEAVELIRNYYQEKVKVVNMIYFLFLNLYLEFMTKDDYQEYS